LQLLLFGCGIVAPLPAGRQVLGVYSVYNLVVAPCLTRTGAISRRKRIFRHTLGIFCGLYSFLIERAEVLLFLSFGRAKRVEKLYHLPHSPLINFSFLFLFQSLICFSRFLATSKSSYSSRYTNFLAPWVDVYLDPNFDRRCSFLIYGSLVRPV